MKRWTIWACLLALACGPVRGQRGNETTDGPGPLHGRIPDAEALILGNAAFILYHELGHALVNLLGLPVAGWEEDAVDGFATLRMARWPADSENESLVLAAAHGRYVTNDFFEEKGKQDEFWGPHGLDLQRYYATVCLFAGSTPERRELGIGAGLPEQRAEECADEYKMMREGWDRLLAPHVANDSAVTSPLRRTDRRSAMIRVRYGKPKSEAHRRVRDLVKGSGMMERAADDVQSLVALPTAVRAVFRSCGFGGEFVVLPGPGFGRATVTVCYGYLARLGRLFDEGGAGDRMANKKAEKEASERRQAIADAGKGAMDSRMKKGDAMAHPRIFPGMSRDEETVALFVLGNAVFAVFRGLAAALIHDLDLPIVTSEADSADAFAAVAMIPETPTDALGDLLVAAAADGWRLAGAKLEEEGGELPTWNGGKVDIQRYYAVICLFVGSDLRGLREFGKMSGLPGRRVKECPAEYYFMSGRWGELLREGSWRGGESGSIDVAYEEAGEGAEGLRALVMDSGLVERAAQAVMDLVDLPRDLVVVLVDCADDGGEADETFFDAEGGRVVICYSYLMRVRALGWEAVAKGLL